MPNISNLKEYCENSSLAGVPYILTSFGRLHRIFWTLVVLTLTGIPIYISIEAIRDWNANPERRSIVTGPVTDFAFPAVTVCPSKTTPWLAFHDILNRFHLTNETEFLLQRTRGRMFKLRMLNYYESFNYEQISVFRNKMHKKECLECKNSTWSSNSERLLYMTEKLVKEDCNHEEGLLCQLHQIIYTLKAEIQANQTYKEWGKSALKITVQQNNLTIDGTKTPWIEDDILEIFLHCTAKNMITDEMIAEPSDFLASFIKKLRSSGLSSIKASRANCDWAEAYERKTKENDVTCAREDIPLPADPEDTADELLASLNHLVSSLLSIVERTENGSTLCWKPEFRQLVDSLSNPNWNELVYTNLLRMACSAINSGVFGDNLDDIQGFPRNSSDIECDSSDEQIGVSSEKLRKIKTSLSMFAFREPSNSPSQARGFCAADSPALDGAITGLACKMRTSLAVVNFYLALMRPDIGLFGSTYAWLMRNHVNTDLELYIMYLREDLDEPGINKEIRNEYFALEEVVLSAFSSDLSLWDLQNSVLYLTSALYPFLNEFSLQRDSYLNPLSFPRFPYDNCRHSQELLFDFQEEIKDTNSIIFGSLREPDFTNVEGKGTYGSYCRDKKHKDMLSVHCNCVRPEIPLSHYFSLLRHTTLPSPNTHQHLDRHPKGLELKLAGHFQRSQLAMIPFCLYGEDLRGHYVLSKARAGNKHTGDQDKKTAFEKAFGYPQCLDFYPQPSDIQMCQTFNGRPLSTILRPSPWLETFLANFTSEPTEANVRNFSGTGEKNGFMFVFDSLQHINVSNEKWFGRKLQPDPNQFTIKIHANTDLARMAKRDILTKLTVVRPNNQSITSIKIQVDGELTTSTRLFKEMSVEKRNCFYPEEGHLRLFKIYSQSNCELECRWRHAASICGCKPWHIPAEKDEEVCPPTGNMCFTSIMLRMEMKNPSIVPDCKCLPDCDFSFYYMFQAADYTTEKVVKVADDEGSKNFTTQQNENTIRPFENIIDIGSYIMDVDHLLQPQDPFLDELMGSPDRHDVHSSQALERQGNFFKVHFFMTENKASIQITKRDEVMSLPDKISWIGGTIGAFNGFCMMSLIEIIYWLLMTLFGYKSNRVNPEEAANPREPNKRCHERYERLRAKLEILKERAKKYDSPEEEMGLF